MWDSGGGSSRGTRGSLLQQTTSEAARGPGTWFWAVSKDRSRTHDLILQNSPRASEYSGKHHFGKLESGRHCWCSQVGGAPGVPPLAHPGGAGADGQGMGRDGTLAEAWTTTTLPSLSLESPGTVSWRFKVSTYIYQRSLL